MTRRILLGLIVILGLTARGSSQPYPAAEFIRSQLIELEEKLGRLKERSSDHESTLKLQLSLLSRYEEARRSEEELMRRLQDSTYPPERLPNYRISPWDTLKVSVSGDKRTAFRALRSEVEVKLGKLEVRSPEFQATLQQFSDVVKAEILMRDPEPLIKIESDGTIRLPGIMNPSDIGVVGLTASELENAIAQKLTKFIGRVSVSVVPSYRISPGNTVWFCTRSSEGVSRSWPAMVKSDGKIWLTREGPPLAVVAVGLTTSELQNVMMARSKPSKSRFRIGRPYDYVVGVTLSPSQQCAVPEDLGHRIPASPLRDDEDA